MDKKITFLGMVLVIIGALWTLSNLNLIDDQWILPLIGIILFTAYLYRGGRTNKGSIGFLIAGCIVFMVGLFAILNDNLYLGKFEGALFFFFVGLAFLSVYVIHTRHQINADTGSQKWPLITGLIIIAFGLFVLFTETAHIPIIRRIYSIIWPLVLIFLGLFIIFKKARKSD